MSNIYGFLNNQVIAPVKSVTPNLFQVDNKMELYKVDNKKIDSYKLDINSPVKPIPTEKEALTFKDVAIKWFKYKYSFTIQSKDNVNPLSKKTLEGYNKIMNSRIIPFFIKQFIPSKRHLSCC